ncbi:hypothetical protein B0H10DRAFT_2214365 [Mycena sp. CBHHK59/15]|nr:hypothetical protein B0H10DRAFT_2214365 [Mycena sp. CBHHK59/15]
MSPSPHFLLSSSSPFLPLISFISVGPNDVIRFPPLSPPPDPSLLRPTASAFISYSSLIFTIPSTYSFPSLSRCPPPPAAPYLGPRRLFCPPRSLSRHAVTPSLPSFLPIVFLRLTTPTCFSSSRFYYWPSIPAAPSPPPSLLLPSRSTYPDRLPD